MRTFFDFLKYTIGPWWSFLASLSSVAAIILLFVNNETACICALGLFCFGLLLIVVGILRGISNFVEKTYKDPYKKIASFFIFKSEDGVNSTFETYRLIQSKRPFLSTIQYDYKWTGNVKPQLASDPHRVVRNENSNDRNTWDRATIKFQHPLKYDECAVLHIKTVNEDKEKVAKPWINAKLDSPIEVITFRVLLPYKEDSFNEPAYFERRKIDAQVDGEYEHIECVAFDRKCKSYFISKHYPEAGYSYRLRWEK